MLGKGLVGELGKPMGVSRERVGEANDGVAATLMSSWVADLPVVLKKRGNARGGKGQSRVGCSAGAPRLHLR